MAHLGAQVSRSSSSHQQCLQAAGHSFSGTAAAARRRSVVAAAEADEDDSSNGRPDLRELTKDDFWEYLDGAGDSLVVVDFFTDW